MDFADDFVVDDPLTFFIFLKGNLLSIYSGLEVILGFLVSPSSVCLNFSIIVFTNFGMLEFFWNC